LRGRHFLPPYYCAKCNEIFDDKETLCKHQKDNLCSPPDDGSKMDGLDSVQLDSVQKFRAKKGESVGEGWLRLWAIVTRNAPKPPLALIFMGSKSEEAAGLIRWFLDSQKPAIAAGVPVRLASIPGITPENVGAIVDGVTVWLLRGILDSSAPVTATLRPNPAAVAAAGASNVDALGQPLESDNWQPSDGGLSDADGEFEPDAHPDDEGQHQDEPLSLTDVAAGSQASMEIDPPSLSPFLNDSGDFSWQNTDIDPGLLSLYPLVPLLRVDSGHLVASGSAGGCMLLQCASGCTCDFLASNHQQQGGMM
jgi:hypothetical protein